MGEDPAFNHGGGEDDLSRVLQTNTILPERKCRVREFMYRICVHSGA